MLRVRSVDTDVTLKVLFKRLQDKPPAKIDSTRFRVMLKEAGLPPVKTIRLVLE